MEKQLDKISRKREKYQRAWASDMITDAEFEKRMNETKELFDELQRKIKEYEPNDKINRDELKELILTFNEFFRDLKKEEQKEFIQQFIRKIEFYYVENPPVMARSKKGKTTIKIKNIEFY